VKLCIKTGPRLGFVFDLASYMEKKRTAYCSLNLPREMFHIRQKPGLVPSLGQNHVESVRLGLASIGERRKQ